MTPCPGECSSGRSLALWRDTAARPTEIEAERPEVGFLLGCAVDVIRDVALGQVDLTNPLGDQKALPIR